MNGISSFFKSIFDKKDSGSGSSPVTNPFTSVRFLAAHTEIVRVLIQIDSTRYVSAGDDGTIWVWDAIHGRSICSLSGHTRAVTCCLLLDDGSTLVSGGKDKSLRLWNIDTGNVINVIDNAHSGSITCLTKLSPSQFCSGGNDSFLHIWSQNGDNEGTIKRIDEDNLNALLPLPGERIITGSDSKVLHLYSTESKEFLQSFTSHRDSVRCLTNLNDELFTSASLDGAIIVWRSLSLLPHQRLAFPDYHEPSTGFVQYNQAVHSMLVLGKRFLAVCVDNGFRVYDTLSGDCVMEKEKAHAGRVQFLLSLNNGSRFVTAGSDGVVKLWGSSRPFNFSDGARRSSAWRLKNNFYPPECMGEMAIHSSAVTALLKLSEDSFVSASADGVIIQWTNGEVAQDHLFPHAFDNFLAANPHFVPNPPSRPFSSDLPFYGDSPLKVSFRRMYWGGEEVNLFEQINPDTSEEESDDDLVTATEGEGELGFGGGVEKDESNSPAASSYYLRASFRTPEYPSPQSFPMSQSPPSPYLANRQRGKIPFARPHPPSFDDEMVDVAEHNV